MQKSKRNKELHEERKQQAKEEANQLKIAITKSPKKKEPRTVIKIDGKVIYTVRDRTRVHRHEAQIEEPVKQTGPSLKVILLTPLLLAFILGGFLPGVIATIILMNLD